MIIINESDIFWKLGCREKPNSQLTLKVLITPILTKGAVTAVANQRSQFKVIGVSSFCHLILAL